MNTKVCILSVLAFFLCPVATAADVTDAALSTFRDDVLSALAKQDAEGLRALSYVEGVAGEGPPDFTRLAGAFVRLGAPKKVYVFRSGDRMIKLLDLHDWMSPHVDGGELVSPNLTVVAVLYLTFPVRDHTEPSICLPIGVAPGGELRLCDWIRTKQ